jgi:hypothetical protein
MCSLSVAFAGCATTTVRPASSKAEHVQMAPIANPPTVQPEPQHDADHEHERQRENQPQREDHPAPDAAANEQAQKLRAAPAAEPARAAQLRAAGLEQLNRGAIRKAVALLEQARRLDPNSVLIKRDLDRAIRISRAVASRP